MVKHFIITLILTILGIYFIKELATAFHLIGIAQSFLIVHLDRILGKIYLAHFISRIIVLMIVPCLIWLIPAFFYWIFSRQELPKAAYIFWIIWIISLTVFALFKA